MVPFSLFLALKYLRPKRSFISVVTVISIIGVLLGVAILVIVQSVMTGFDEMWCEKILSFKPHLTVVSRYGVIEDEDELCAKIEEIKDIKGTAPVIDTLVMARHETTTRAPVVLGVAPDRADKVSKVSSCIRYGKFDLEGQNAVLGYDLALELGVNVGSKFLVYSPKNVTAKDEVYLPEELTVAGVFDMGMRDFDSGVVLTSLEVARELVGYERGAAAIYVMTSDPFRYEEFAEAVRDKVGLAYAVRTWRDIDSLMFSALSYEKTMMFVLLVFITVVAIFCVMNTLIVVTVQKTGEIGLLRALGFSSWQIMGAFVWHGWIQCLVGTFSGLGVGLLILNNLKRIVRFLAYMNVEVFPKRIYGLSEIPWATSFDELAKIAVMVFVFCTLASLIPAARAARLDPVEALRQE
jgi:lipoprotein-releasing system permease protein